MGILRRNYKMGADLYFAVSEFFGKHKLIKQLIRSYILIEQPQVKIMRDMVFWLNFAAGTGFVIMGATLILLIGVA
jgi:hypothetical protein